MQVCKPGSVSRLLGTPVIYLDPDSHLDSIDLPTPESCRSRNRTSSSLPGAYLIFQPIRFAMPPSSLSGRWALTPPFHPYLLTDSGQALYQYGGLFSVALAVFWPSPAKSLPVRKYGALCCPDFPPSRNRKSDRTTCTHQSTSKSLNQFLLKGQEKIIEKIFKNFQRRKTIPALLCLYIQRLKIAFLHSAGLSRSERGGSFLYTVQTSLEII